MAARFLNYADSMESVVRRFISGAVNLEVWMPP